MQWIGRRGSSNIEDRRGMGGGSIIAGGGIGSLLIAAVIYLLGGNPGDYLGSSSGVQGGAPTEQRSVQENKHAEFVSVVLADTEEVWTKLFREQGNAEYQQPKLVLFTGQVQSACGGASAASGPFYCPADQKAYIDLSFYDDLSNRFGAGGDFAMAYVIAHEIGHHIQYLLGISEKMQRARSQMSEKEYNQMSVRLELQADFLAGVWAHHNQKMNKVIEAGDIEEALRAANAIGDDKLQKQSQGEVVPDAFTHGTSEQRMRWFKKGWETGDLKYMDTFSASEL